MDIINDTPPAVNGSRLINGLTSRSRATHCPNGHEYPLNTRRSNDGFRICRACASDRKRRHRQAKRESAPPTQPRPLRTHCHNNHEYTPENTRYRKDGVRLCRKCATDRERRRYQTKKNATLNLARLPLSPLAYATALYLQANAKRLVTHEEIVTRGWQRIYVPSDKNNVEVQINKIRKALGDTSTPRRFVDTRTLPQPHQLYSRERISAYVWIGPTASEDQ